MVSWQPWAVVQASKPCVHAQPSDFAVLCAGKVPGCIQSAHRAELYAILAALHVSQNFAGVVRLWSDCESAIVRFREHVYGGKPVKASAIHFDLWQQIVQLAVSRGHDKLFIAKVPSHEDLDSAADDIERWAYVGNSLADKAAGAANLDRPQWVWDMWFQLQQQHCQLQYIGEQVRTSMLKVSQQWQTARLSDVDLVASTRRPAKEGRTFQQKWSSPGIIHSVGGVWHRRFHTMEALFLQWWNSNIQNGRDIVWVSFVQLYLDWMMTTQHMGVLNLNRQWIDTGASLGRMPEQYRFRLRAKWWRLCMQQFWKNSGVTVGTGTCRPQSRTLQVFLGSASLPWPSHRLAAIDDWLAQQCGSAVRGNGHFLDMLPMPAKSLGLDPI